MEYVREDLAPALAPGDIVVMDNLSRDTGEAVREVIEATGAELRFLPPCSRDLNLIEMVFAKLGAGCGKPRSGTAKALEKNSDILDCIDPGACANYLRHAGYVPT